MLKWYEETGDNQDIVISARIRLARNLSKYPFPAKLHGTEAKNMIQECFQELNDFNELDNRNYEHTFLDELSDLEKVALVERHSLTPLLITKQDPTGVIISEDEAISIMINEEDHLRIQTLTGGMNLTKVYRMADKIDDIINRKFEYAFDDKYGYLTSCPTNIGTGLRASYMVHLPAMASSKRIQRLATEVSRFGITIRGIYGEGSSSEGDLYQISNQRTLGQTEEEIMNGLNTIVNQIISQERNLREKFLKNNKKSIEDQVYRSYGVLKYARKMVLKDAMTLLSHLMMGVGTGILHVADNEDSSVYKLMMGIQPANLEKLSERPIGSEERDIIRAEYIRKHLPEML